MTLSRLQRWLLVAAVVVVVVLLYRHYELGRWLTLDQLK